MSYQGNPLGCGCRSILSSSPAPVSPLLHVSTVGKGCKAVPGGGGWFPKSLSILSLPQAAREGGTCKSLPIREQQVSYKIPNYGRKKKLVKSSNGSTG